jgi:hypothetical protein
MADGAALIFAGLTDLRGALCSNDPPRGIQPEDLDGFTNDDGQLAIASAFVLGHWPEMREMITAVAFRTPLRWDNEPVCALIFHDPVLHRVGKRLADAFADLTLDGQLPSAPSNFTMSLLLRTDAGDYLASTLLSNFQALSVERLRLLVGATTDPALKSAAVGRLLEDLDTECASAAGDTSLLDEMLSEPDPDGSVGASLLAARPKTDGACTYQMNLVSNRIERTGWLPNADALTAMYRAIFEVVPPDSNEWSAVPIADRFPLLLRGAARTVAKSNMGRSAAVLSLCHLKLVAADIESLGRGIFESTRVSAWPVLHEILDNADPPTGPLSSKDADLFHVSILSAVGQLLRRGETERLDRLLDIGHACVALLNGPPGENTQEFVSLAESVVAGDSDGPDGYLEVIDSRFMGMAVWGSTDPDDLATSLIIDDGCLSVGDRFVLPGHSILEFAQRSSLTRRRGPAAMLLLVDMAVEGGDLRQAQTYLEMTSLAYPKSSVVLEWQVKLDLHVGNTRRALGRRSDLAELWRNGDDEESPLAQVGAMERLSRLSAFSDLAREHAQRVRDQPCFAAWVQRLDRVISG